MREAPLKFEQVFAFLSTLNISEYSDRFTVIYIDGYGLLTVWLCGKLEYIRFRVVGSELELFNPKTLEPTERNRLVLQFANRTDVSQNDVAKLFDVSQSTITLAYKNSQKQKSRTE